MTWPIWKSCLQIEGHFVQASMCEPDWLLPFPEVWFIDGVASQLATDVGLRIAQESGPVGQDAHSFQHGLVTVLHTYGGKT